MTTPKLPLKLAEQKRFPFTMAKIEDYTAKLSGSGINTYHDHYFLVKDNHIIMNGRRGFVCNVDIRVVASIQADLDDNEVEIKQLPYIAIHKNPDFEALTQK